MSKVSYASCTYVEIFSSAPNFADAVEQQLEVVVIIHEIQVFAIHHQQRRLIIVMEELAIAVSQARQIIIRNGSLITVAAPPHTLRQRISGSLQVYHQVGRGRLRRQALIDGLVELVLVVAQSQARKQRILLEQVVGDGAALEQIHLRHVARFIDALKQEKQLRGQSVTHRVLIETRQERIVLRLFQQELRFGIIGQALRQTGLADTDGTFHYDI